MSDMRLLKLSSGVPEVFVRARAHRTCPGLEKPPISMPLYKVGKPPFPTILQLYRHKIGRRSPELTPQMRGRILELHSLRYSMQWIATKYQLPKSTVQYTIKKEHER
jgi:hypothetical protein